MEPGFIFKRNVFCKNFKLKPTETEWSLNYMILNFQTATKEYSATFKLQPYHQLPLLGLNMVL